MEESFRLFGLTVGEIVQMLTALAAFIAIIGAQCTSRRQSRDNKEALGAQLEISRLQLKESHAGRIAQMRQEWVEEFRKEGARMLYLLTSLFEYRSPDLSPHPGDTWDRITTADFRRIKDEYEDLYARISLRLNAKEGSKEQELLDLIDAAKEASCDGAEARDRFDKGMISEVDYSREQENAADRFMEKWEAVRDTLQEILKTEWERVKKAEI